jgi:hypothetical protein
MIAIRAMIVLLKLLLRPDALRTVAIVSHKKTQPEPGSF